MFFFLQVIERTKKNTEEKMRSVKYIGNGVTDTAQNLMNYISRMYADYITILPFISCSFHLVSASHCEPINGDNY